MKYCSPMHCASPSKQRENLAALIRKRGHYQGSVSFVEVTGQMEAAVRGFGDYKITERIALNYEQLRTPDFSAYSILGDGFS